MSQTGFEKKKITNKAIVIEILWRIGELARRKLEMSTSSMVDAQ